MTSEDQAVIAKVLARHLWRALSRRLDAATLARLDEALTVEARRIVDALFDAAEIVWERHRILVEPCRPVLTDDQVDLFIAVHPGGETRNITRDQLLMMAGMDLEAVS